MGTTERDPTRCLFPLPPPAPNVRGGARWPASGGGARPAAVRLKPGGTHRSSSLTARARPAGRPARSPPACTPGRSRGTRGQLPGEAWRSCCCGVGPEAQAAAARPRPPLGKGRGQRRGRPSHGRGRAPPPRFPPRWHRSPSPHSPPLARTHPAPPPGAAPGPRRRDEAAARAGRC